jgi:hypothetical protein
MADFFASLSIWTGAVLAVLTVLDWALTNRQKNWLTDCAIALFVWLDDQRELKYLKYLGKFRWQRIVIILYGMLVLVGALLMTFINYTGGFDQPEIPPAFGNIIIEIYLGTLVGVLVMIRIMPRVLNWITKTEGSLLYIVKSTLALIATLLVYSMLALIQTPLISRMQTYLNPSSREDIVLTMSDPFSNPIVTLIYSVFAGACAAVVGVVLLSWIFVVGPVVIILILMLFLRVIQFITARIAENPKGPILGVSGLLTAIGALAKLFL